MFSKIISVLALVVSIVSFGLTLHMRDTGPKMVTNAVILNHLPREELYAMFPECDKVKSLIYSPWTGINSIVCDNGFSQTVLKLK